jgi:UDP-3-O-[3-hydroxymyristoyl] glucosamine N-acyltransferase
MTLKEIAELVGGAVRGDPGLVIEGAAGLVEATPTDISFLGNAKYTSRLKTTRAGAVLVSPETETDGRPAILLKNPPYGWARVLEVIERERRPTPAPGVHPTAVVHPTAKLGKGVSVGAHCVVEEHVSIGDGTTLFPQVYLGAHVSVGAGCLFHPRVTVRERCVIGDRCLFQPGVVIGCDGFGFTLHQGKHLKIPQSGIVVIEDDVEVQANSTIDRATTGVTRVGRGTKIDNLVQVAHNVELGENCLVVALTGIAGSTKLGDYVVLAAQVGVAGHLTVGDRVTVGARGGISHDIKAGETLWGTPAQPLKDELKQLAVIRRLPDLFEELKAIKKKLGL